MAEARDRWASRPAFIMAAVGSAIGLGNVWRFPGVAFFVPYFIALLTAGIPLMIVEYGIGSRYQGSAAKSYRGLGKKYEWIGWWAVGIVADIVLLFAIVQYAGLRRLRGSPRAIRNPGPRTSWPML